MSLVRFSNGAPVLFNRFIDNNTLDWRSRSNVSMPSVNIKEDDSGYELEVAVPGFDKSDFKIELNNDILTIASEKKEEKESGEEKKFNRREFSYQAFSRSFSLPKSVDGNKINASYDKGILHISIPKKEEEKAKPSRVIDIE